MSVATLPESPPRGSDVEQQQGPRNASSRPPVVKLSFNVAQHQVEALKQIAEERGVSMTEVLRHAISLELYLQQETDEGARIIVENRKTGDRREIVMIGI